MRPFYIGDERCSAHPLTRYLGRETSMIFTTKAAKAIQSIAIAITVEVSIGIASFSGVIWQNAIPLYLLSIDIGSLLGNFC